MDMAKTRILLTGANSLTGSHILSQLLSQGTFSVRAVVDSREAAYALQHLYPRIAPGSLDLAIVLAQDASTPRVFEAALSDHSRPFDVVIHTLSPTPYGVADCLAKVINLETEKTSNFLKSVQQVARAVRRVVIVTSLTPFARWLVDPLGQVDRSVPGGTDYTSSSRVPNSEYILATSQASDNIVYDAVSRWTREASITFDVVYLTAPSIYGPAIRSLASSSDISESNRRIWNICCNESAENSRMPPYGISKFLDVRDLALASVRALFIPANNSMGNQLNTHFFISAGTMLTDCEIAGFLVAHYPRLRGRVGLEGASLRQTQLDDPTLSFLDTYLTTRVLGISQYHSAEETLAATAQQIVDLLDRKSWKHTIMRND